MGHAFVTTNPMLPAEYFAPQGMDEVVLKANEGVEHSLLDCPGNFTVMVAHFNGRSKVVISQKDMEKELSILNRTKAEDSPLVEAAEKAHNLTMTLRKQGIEAYEFHDRSASIVTVGSFASFGSKGQDGQTELDPRIAKIIEQYRARSAGTAADQPNPPRRTAADRPDSQAVRDRTRRRRATGTDAELIARCPPANARSRRHRRIARKARNGRSPGIRWAWN